MTPDDLARTLQTGDGQQRDRTLGCPDEHRIAAWVDGSLAAEDRQALELHLADCGHCLALVGLLGRDRDAEPGEPVSEIVLARAGLPGRDAGRRWRPSAPQWAAAAMVLVSVPILLQLAGPPSGVAERSPAPAERATRNLPADRHVLDVLQPTAGATVDPDRLTVRWTAIPGSDYYDLRIVTDAGALVVEQRVAGTEWRPTQHIDLDRGARYFVHIDAYPSDGKAVGSAHVPFRTVD